VEEDIHQGMTAGGLAFQNQPLKKKNKRKNKSVLKKAGNLCKGDCLRFEVLTVALKIQIYGTLDYGNW
jgi:hypothetical protein